jgi:hypothetical protein
VGDVDGEFGVTVKLANGLKGVLGVAGDVVNNEDLLELG